MDKSTVNKLSVVSNSTEGEPSIEHRLIENMKMANGKWRSEGILTMSFNSEELSSALKALKDMAERGVISTRMTMVDNKFEIKEYRYHEGLQIRLNRNRIKVVK